MKKTRKKAPTPRTTPDSDKDEPRSGSPRPNDEAEPVADTASQEVATEEADEEEAHEDTSYLNPDDVPYFEKPTSR